MKMGFLFSQIFWGIVLIIFGLSIVINIVFKVNIPVFRVVFAFILVYAGLTIMLGKDLFQSRSEHNVMFNEMRVNVTNANMLQDYNVIFGKGIINLTEISLTQGTVRTEINTVFGGSEIIVASGTPVKIMASSVFGGAKLPDGNTISFGDYTYRSPNFKEGEPYLEIKASVVFGGMDIYTR